jgi:hypothetical protein
MIRKSATRTKIFAERIPSGTVIFGRAMACKKTNGTQAEI